MPPISVLIKPASGKCNLRCEYCFYKDITENRDVTDFGFMSLNTLEAIVKKVLQFADGSATFSFQGGEPTLSGLDYFHNLIAYQKKYNNKNVTITNCIQTNGVVLDERWAEFLKHNNFLVGLSLDGPQELHNKYRKDAHGDGTYSTVIQKARLLEKYDVDFNILFVVTRDSAQKPGKLYSFFQRNNFKYLQFIPCLDPMAEKRGAHRYSLLPAEYTQFLKKFFDRWSEDLLSGNDVSIRYFDNLVRILMGQEPETCSMRGTCSCQFVFEADGSCYPCDFYVTDKWKLGNIHEKSIMELFETETCQRFLKTSTAVAQDCLHCKWRRLCRGGCRRDRETPLNSVLEKNYYCRTYTDFLSYAYPKLAEIAQYVVRRSG